MNDLLFRQPLARRSVRFLPLVVIAMIVIGMGAIPAPRASAHAELVRAEPSMDGLVIAPPDQLHLFFSEDVATTDPAPSIRLLDENGQEKPVTIEPQGVDPREVVADLEDLHNGTWTVAWSVKSSTDGHVLSGTYAFRIGGGLPPGLATVEGEQPQVWAIATRWITFLGAAIAAAGFLFGVVMFARTSETIRSSRRRTRLVVAGAALALIATAIEPVLQVLFPVEGIDLKLSSALRGLPAGWWYRPAGLIPLLILALIAAYPMRGRIPAPIGIAGGAFGLLSLLGLSFTSHSAAGDSWRQLAIASDTLHQWSTALWVGGLSSAALWWTSRSARSAGATADASDAFVPSPEGPVPFPIRRFSSIALWLFVLAVVTGLLNAGLVFPARQTDLPFGLGTATLPAISKLWSSDYGIVLLIKSLVLLIPFGLAAYHHRAIARATRTGAGLAAGVLGKTLRLESLVVCAVVLGGSILALSAAPTIFQNALTNVVLASFANPAQGDPTQIVHLTVDPAKQGKNALTIRLTDLQGMVPPKTDPARISLSFSSLSHGTLRSDVSAQPTDLAASTYTAEGLDLSIDGWWKIMATVDHDNQPPTSAAFYMLLPDPNVHGFDAPPAPDTDPAAELLYQKALKATTSLTAIRRTEHIGSGRDALVVADYSWTTGTNGQPPSFESETLFSGSFVSLPNGSLPALPRLNTYHSITIGELSWENDGDLWVPQSPVRYQPPSEWDSTYTGAQEFQFGTTEGIDGEECQIVTFHTPNAPSQSEAWFAWWVGKDTGLVRQTTMVANQHYMVWNYRDFNQNFMIQAPPDPKSSAAPVASPSVATPAGQTLGTPDDLQPTSEMHEHESG
jgi:copper transport protein